LEAGEWRKEKLKKNKFKNKIQYKIECWRTKKRKRERGE
jgi:hypothetical protein